MTDPAPAAPVFARSEVASVLLIGVMMGFVPSLQPLLLGGLVTEGRITLAQVGQAAMIEALGMAFAVASAGSLLKPERLKWIGIGAALLALLANLGTTQLSGTAIIAVRLFSGICTGLLAWIWLGLLTRIPAPARLIAIYVTLQSASLLVLSTLFVSVLIPAGGTTAGYACIAAINAIMMVLACFAPSRFQPLDGQKIGSLPRGRGIAGLIALTMHLAAIMGFWVYVGAIGKYLGRSQAEIGFTISFALGSQIFAGIAMTFLAHRFNAVRTTIACAWISIGAIFMIAFMNTALPFLAGVTIVAFFWIIAMPFSMPYLIEIDPSRRAAMQLVTAQLLGVSAGPALASMAVGAQGASGALWTSCALFAAASLTIAATKFSPGKRIAAETAA